MGTKDTTQKRLEDYADIFADICNFALYDGEDVIKEDELETITAKDTYTVEQKIHEIERDVAKSWKHNSLHLSLKGDEITMKKIVSLGFDEARAEAKAEGLAEGEAVGMAKGKAEGEANEKFATVKRMLSLGKSLQDIALCTDLPLAKVQELQAEL